MPLLAGIGPLGVPELLIIAFIILLVFGVGRHILYMAVQALRRGIFNQHVLLRGGQSEDIWFNEAMSHFAEELGATRLFHGTVGDAAMVVALSGPAPEGSSFGLSVPPPAVHLFDPATGDSLRK